MRIISFYTKNTPYENETKGFIASAKSFKLNPHIEALDNLGTWEKNCQLKPRFIRDKLRQFNQPLLWVDIDARFFGKPVAQRGDFAVRTNPHAPHGHRCHILSGTIYLKPVQAVFDLLDHWIHLCHHSTLWDQQLLAVALDSFQGVLTPLPHGYCWIHREKPIPSEPIIINHYQASNMYKTRLHETIPELDARKIQMMSRLGISDLDKNALSAMQDFLDVIQDC